MSSRNACPDTWGSAAIERPYPPRIYGTHSHAASKRYYCQKPLTSSVSAHPKSAHPKSAHLHIRTSAHPHIQNPHIRNPHICTSAHPHIQNPHIQNPHIIPPPPPAPPSSPVPVNPFSFLQQIHPVRIHKRIPF
jgi:hypothetical protein